MLQDGVSALGFRLGGIGLKIKGWGNVGFGSVVLARIGSSEGFYRQLHGLSQ